MLIDATHPEETRVVVLRGNRVEEFDFESANRKQLRGNIYLAKVTRVEPSLQAAFVDYGGNRHGFLAFSEIHPDYYQIPVADRQALIDEEERAARAADAEADNRARRGDRERPARRPRHEIKSAPVESESEIVTMAAAGEVVAPEAGDHDENGEANAAPAADAAQPGEEPGRQHEGAEAPDAQDTQEQQPALLPSEPQPIELAQIESSAAAEPLPQAADAPQLETSETAGESASAESSEAADAAAHSGEPGTGSDSAHITEVNGDGANGEEEVIESVGGADAMEEMPERSYRSRRQYKIQEVIKRRQVMLVQVVKEERGSKGAALTTYLSLAGRYSVLMPNTARGGGISRKITSAEDRRKLKEIAQELAVPEGMGVILRTAGAARTKSEVKRDFEYLLRLWETVRDLTLKSTAPTLVYEEGSLVKRSIRDLYNKDIDEIIVAGDEAYKEAKDFMRMLMPSHAKNVKPYHESLPVFTRLGIESQLDAMFQPVVQLRSGGYIVLNQAEALVAIDVNSGRATREHHIEDTALKTNQEAAEEIARQLRLRDLAGLIVIDFIDMDEKRNNRTVERRLKEALKHDRARIQVGHISHFGLLEMSRQRIRSSVLESSTEKCPHCGGSGHVRSVSSVALQLLRALEEMLLKGATHNLIVRTRTEIALYLLNQKRAHLRALEERFQVAIMINADASIGGQVSYAIDRGEQVHSLEQAKAIAVQPTSVAPVEDEEDEEAPEVEAEAEEAAEAVEAAEPAEETDAEARPAERADGNGDGRHRRRRRRGGRGGRGGESEGREAREPVGFAAAENGGEAIAHHEDAADAARQSGEEPAEAVTAGEDGEGSDDAERRRRRRGRRGGRRRRGREGEAQQPAADAAGSFEPESDAPHAHQADDFTPAAEERHDDARHGDAREAEAPRERAPVDMRSHEPEPVEPPQPETHAPEPRRRRSTVREPAPVSLDAVSAPAPMPEPAFVPTHEPPTPAVSNAGESEETNQPRRSGWWSRRILGKG
jgi:ribonuclease E